MLLLQICVYILVCLRRDLWWFDVFMDHVCICACCPYVWFGHRNLQFEQSRALTERRLWNKSVCMSQKIKTGCALPERCSMQSRSANTETSMKTGIFNIKRGKSWRSFMKREIHEVFIECSSLSSQIFTLTLSWHKRLPQVVREIKAVSIMTEDNSASLSGAIALSHFISSLPLPPFLAFSLHNRLKYPKGNKVN